jgi:DNA (cytosine-5)-methyltransferase 1
LCAGFPCQPFSQAGKKKGFKDNKNGNLFFSIENILKVKKPKAFILENVRHLRNHDNGKTFKKIYQSLTNLNYTFDFEILKASDFGLPQYRQRIYMVGFYKPFIQKKYYNLPFIFPKKIKLKKTMSDIFGGFCSKDLSGKEERKIGFTLRVGGKGSSIDDRRNWDAYYVNGEVKRIGPQEGKRMQGFPDSFLFPVSKAEAMKQLGNSVAINAVEAVACNILKVLESQKNET